MKIRPLHDRILVKRVEGEDEVGGILIPDTAQEKPKQADVVAVGKGKKDDDGKFISLDVKKGDRIVLGKYSGTEIDIENIEYVIIREDDVLGVVE